MVGENDDSIVNGAFLGSYGFISEENLEDRGAPNLLNRNELVAQFKAHHYKYMGPLVEVVENPKKL
jgi:hypothetical protein